MRKWIAYFLLLALPLSLAACGARAAAPAGMVQTTAPEQTSFSFQETVGEQTLIMQAVAEPEMRKECVYLTYDENAQERLFQELVGSEENLRKENETQRKGIYWGIDKAGTEEVGWAPGDIYYLDVARDQNGEPLDPGHSLEPNYFTQQIPNGMEKTGKEVAEETGAFLENYSCLTFVPWNVCAYQGSPGLYSMKLKCLYEGKDILGGFSQFSANISPEGLFDFQGTLLLKEDRREEIPKPMTLAEAVERLKTDFAGYSLAKTVTIDKIGLQYYGEETPEGWILHPAWVFSGMESAQQLDCAYESPNPKDEPVAFCYFLDDGFLEVFTSSFFEIF